MNTTLASNCFTTKCWLSLLYSLIQTSQSVGSGSKPVRGMSAVGDGEIRSSPLEVFLGKGVLKICRKLTGEHPCWSVISIKFRCNSWYPEDRIFVNLIISYASCYGCRGIIKFSVVATLYSVFECSQLVHRTERKNVNPCLSVVLISNTFLLPVDPKFTGSVARSTKLSRLPKLTNARVNYSIN